MEPRQLLSVTPSPIHVGATYFEDSNQEDTSSLLKINGAVTDTEVADIFEVTFNGGANGTTLDRVVINTNGDTFFDTADKGTGDSLPFKILDQTGFEIDWANSQLPADGGTQLILCFKNFTAGDRLVFTIDVDERGPTAVAEGGEFGIPDNYEGDIGAKATVQASFTAPGMQVLNTAAYHFYDTYAFSDSLKKELPDNNMTNDISKVYLPSQCSAGKVYTAGAEGTPQQIPLVEISGYVYFDVNNDGVRNTAAGSLEVGIGGVSISLYDQAGNSVQLLNSLGQASGSSVTTNANGYYHCYVTAGTYRIVEGPEAVTLGYIDGLDTPGAINGVADSIAAAVNPGDRINQVTLVAGDVGTEYNFGEIKLAELSGHVYHDANNDGIRDFYGEDGIDNVHIVVVNLTTQQTYDAYTDADGYWSVTGLMPGQYKVTEYQPDEYFDGKDKAGVPNGGTVHNGEQYDVIDGFQLLSGDIGMDYDFGELKPGCISGYVYVDANNNGVYDEGETPIPGAALVLLDANGNQVETKQTDESGFYRFCGLRPGEYSIRETQPDGYYDGTDREGSAGGFANNPGDLIDSIPLGSGVKATDYNFGELAPASIRGRVFVDLNDNDAYDSFEQLLSGVEIYLLDGSGNRIATTTTAADGAYEFTNLKPGTYGVQENLTPSYLEGGNQKGSLGGTLNAPNQILAISLPQGANGVNYDFWEVQLTIIAGRVFQDGPTINIKEGDPEPNIPSLRDGLWTSDDTPLAGITLILCDGTGMPLEYEGGMITTQTLADGTYQFILNDYQLYYADNFTIRQLRPTGYTPGITTVGSNNGMVVNKYHNLTLSEAGELNLIVDPLGVNGFDLTGMLSASIANVYVNPGDHAVNYNFSEVVIQEVPVDPKNPTPLPNPTPTPPLSPPTALPFGEYRSIGLPYVISQTITPLMAGGSGGPGGYSWHLSIINGGQPRSIITGDRFTQYPQSTLFDPVSWSGAKVDQSQFILADEDGMPVKTIRFGMNGAAPVSGDWNGDGMTQVGVFIDGLWFLDLNGDGVWDEADLWVKLGKKGDQPVSGDWDGDGKTDIGIYGPAWIGDLKAVSVEPGLPDAQNPPSMGRPKNVPPDAAEAAVGWRTLKRGNAGKMRSDVIDHVFQYGSKGDRAISGDWNGDGIRSVGIFRNGVWFLDVDGNGKWTDADVAVEFGKAGDIPVVGDWTGDGADKLGVYRNGTFYLDTNNDHLLDATDKVFQLGQAGDLPIVGDWSGDGVDKVGIYQQNAPIEQQTATQSNAASASSAK